MQLKEDRDDKNSENLLVYAKKMSKGNTREAISECISYLEYALQVKTLNPLNNLFLVRRKKLLHTFQPRKLSL